MADVISQQTQEALPLQPTTHLSEERMSSRVRPWRLVHLRLCLVASLHLDARMWNSEEGARYRTPQGHVAPCTTATVAKSVTPSLMRAMMLEARGAFDSVSAQTA